MTKSNNFIAKDLVVANNGWQQLWPGLCLTSRVRCVFVILALTFIGCQQTNEDLAADSEAISVLESFHSQLEMMQQYLDQYTAQPSIDSNIHYFQSMDTLERLYAVSLRSIRTALRSDLSQDPNNFGMSHLEPSDYQGLTQSQHIFVRDFEENGHVESKLRSVLARATQVPIGYVDSEPATLLSDRASLMPLALLSRPLYNVFDYEMQLPPQPDSVGSVFDDFSPDQIQIVNQRLIGLLGVFSHFSLQSTNAVGTEVDRLGPAVFEKNFTPFSNALRTIIQRIQRVVERLSRIHAYKLTGWPPSTANKSELVHQLAVRNLLQLRSIPPENWQDANGVRNYHEKWIEVLAGYANFSNAFVQSRERTMNILLYGNPEGTGPQKSEQDILTGIITYVNLAAQDEARAQETGDAWYNGLLMLSWVAADSRTAELLQDYLVEEGRNLVEALRPGLNSYRGVVLQAYKQALPQVLDEPFLAELRTVLAQKGRSDLVNELNQVLQHWSDRLQYADLQFEALQRIIDSVGEQ